LEALEACTEAGELTEENESGSERALGEGSDGRHVRAETSGGGRGEGGAFATRNVSETSESHLIGLEMAWQVDV